MVIKRATPFTHPRSPAYTRKSKKRELNYIKGWLPTKIGKFVMGNVEDFNKKKFNCYIWLKSTKHVQIRENALEAARKTILRHLEKKIGKNNFYFSLMVYPHQVLRENKMLTGAGADRLQTGMQLAFGSVVGNAAVVKPGKPIFLVATNNQYVDIVKNIYRMIFPKIPCKPKIEIEIKEKI
ncbi:MAG: 50S ribosomal protein L16 [Candidatus Pacearchaeota archaeon]